MRAAFDDGLLVIFAHQAVPGLGADGAIDRETSIDMKSFAREAPTTESGFHTQIRLYINPLGALPWTLKGTISLGSLGAEML